MNKKMYNLKTLSVTILIVAVIAIASIGGYSSIIMADSLVDNIEVNALNHLKSSDSLFYEKIKNIQRFSDTMSLSESLWNIINQTESHEEFNTFMTRNIANFDDVEACVIISNTGEGYVYNLPTFNDDHLVQLQVSCRQISEKNSLLHWYNAEQSELIEPIFNKYVLCGTSIFNENPAKLYIFVKTDTLNNIIDNVQENSIVSVLDEEGRLIISNSNKEFQSLFYSKSNNLIELYADSQGLFRFENDGQGYVAIHYQSMLNSFKFLEIHKESTFYASCYKIIIFMISIIVLFLFIIITLYLIMAKQFLHPLKKLGQIMSNFDDNSLSTYIDVSGNDEISALATCFNGMIIKINEIIENVKKKDEEKKQAELLALRRQIQPHFIYNTLNSIRILAMYNSQHKIADSLQILARLLKKIFSSKDTFNTLSDDIAFIKDYIYLIQICYKNSIDVSYCISENAQTLMIPSMIIQPLIENAIQHGLNEKLTQKASPIKLYISAQEKNGYLLIEITDNGIGMSEEKIKSLFSTESRTPGSSIGIKNIYERIKLLCGEEYGLKITSKEGYYTTASLVLPVINKESDTN